MIKKISKVWNISCRTSIKLRGGIFENWFERGYRSIYSTL